MSDVVASIFEASYVASPVVLLGGALGATVTGRADVAAPFARLRSEAPVSDVFASVVEPPDVASPVVRGVLGATVTERAGVVDLAVAIAAPFARLEARRR